MAKANRSAAKKTATPKPNANGNGSSNESIAEIFAIEDGIIPWRRNVDPAVDEKLSRTFQSLKVKQSFVIEKKLKGRAKKIADEKFEKYQLLFRNIPPELKFIRIFRMA